MLNYFRRLVAAAGVVCAVLALAICAGFFWYRSASQPRIDGVLRVPSARTGAAELATAAPALVPVPAASAAISVAISATTAAGRRIDIVRDANAVPHIYAGSLADAYFALGFVHAQDRLWQLEIQRRTASGRLAEILGPSALDTDRFLRTLGVRRNAERILPNLAPDAREALQAYADGINAWLLQRRGPLPPEFVITGAPPPAPWEPADSLAWQTMLAWDLGGNWSQELMRMRMAQHLSLAQINELLPPYPGDPVLATRDYTAWYRSLAGTTAQLAAVAAIAPRSQVAGMGSNNWVVSGTRTRSGKPLLANDPHLGLSVPGLWYLAHLSAPGLNVIGASIPGLPAIVLGHNDRIAWGFTNTGPDVQDLYIERINPVDPRQYQTPDGWAAFDVRVESIGVKGQPDVPILVRSTRHGPVISGALPIADRSALDVRTHVIAFAWTALRPDDLTLQAGLRMNRAANWQQFVSAVRDFNTPQQNIGYADVDGNIGFIAPGRIPLRAPENDLHGLAPAPGWDAHYDWQGFIPFESLPRTFNPAGDRIVTANQKIVDADSDTFLTSEWALPYRAERITALLAARDRHDVASFSAMQYDHVSLAALDLLPSLRATRPTSAIATQALHLLAGWDGSMEATLPQPLIVNAWMRELSRRLLAVPLGADLMRDYWDLRTAQPFLVNVLRNAHGASHWCAVPAEGGAPAPADCGALLSQTLDAALRDLQARYGGAPENWHWGMAHVALLGHRPFGKVPWLAPWFDLREPVPGDTYTINVGQYALRDAEAPFASRHGPGLRAIYDLADLENSRFIEAGGQSGNRLSPFYGNTLRPWAAGGSLPMRTRRADVERGQLGTLTLLR